MKQTVSSRSTKKKALRINLDEKKYGTIVEIGAGQEVARQFFRAGAAAGSIAKTMSAYDMQFSDAIYGVQTGGRYVSKARAKAMMEKEFDLVIERVAKTRSKNSRFFAYAATVAAKSWNRDNECHAWCGVRLQMYPGAAPSDIIVHARMLDKTAEQQQEALGVLGVNIIYGAYYYSDNPRKIIDSLTDNLEPDRLEIDSIEFNGPYFEEIDNLGINLHLIRSWKTRAVMFYSDGSVAVPAEMLYKKNVLAIRGSFRPVTKLNVDMIEQGMHAFRKTADVDDDNTIAIAEISLNDSLGNDHGATESDIIERVQLLTHLGYHVMISDYTRYFSLRAYFRQYTQMQIGIVLGIINIRQIFDHAFYRGIEGGMLEGFGKLFPDNTRLYVYPEKNADDLITADNLTLADDINHLYQHLKANHFICSIDCSDTALLDIYSREIIKSIKNGDNDWQAALPEGVAEMITNNGLFGCQTTS
ncbi:TonB-dependent receptor [Ostreibacterium oceani]|uniref:TonB-dependent receptor n=1 Tax=Ostreibacterium oceani TaxID=2654998 RepID=A0A6N7EUZ5_9GAMM|nr:TonB-dependent receptor [Ostreibacterium oceani]MPV85793.1 TonB-dependent receptor [Ostreibacterium oceani]